MKQLRVVVGIVLAVLIMSVSVAAADEVYMPHLTGGFADWGDFLTVDNTGLLSATVTVTLYNDDGTSVYSGSHSVSALGESVINLKQLNSTAHSGKVSYTGDTLNFRLSYVNNTGGGVAEFRLTGNQGSVLGFFFSDFESVTAWKGIALTNHGATSATVKLYAVGGGQVLGSTADITISPYRKISGFHTAWFPALAMNQVKKIIAVSSVATMGGIVITSDLTSSKMLFTAAVPFESFSPGDVVGDFTGTWRGEWVSDEPGYSGDMIAYLVQTGSQVVGTADVDDTDCGDVRKVPVTGTVTENLIAINATYNCDGHIATLAFTQGSKIRNTIYGTYQQNVDGRFYDSGTFSLVKD